MNLLKLSWSYLVFRPLNTFLNILVFTLGIAIIVLLLLFSDQLGKQLSKNTKDIDLVVGAKGSPLQLILSNIFHVDFPTGNISLAEAETLAKNRQVKTAVPLALGDSYNGYRIVGTTPVFVTLYDLKIGEGKLWEEPLEATLGFNTAKNLSLKIGDTFETQHGLTKDGGTHGDPFKVTGILQKTNSVVDNLILTSVQSVWDVHEHHEEGEEHADIEAHHHAPGIKSKLIPEFTITKEDSLKEITSLLIKFRSPMGAIQLPRYVNGNTNMQAASPAFETARLFSLVGIGIDVITGFAYLIIFIATLSIFIALYNSLKERKYDLAVMRTIGATRLKLFISVILEGLMITLIGSLIGFVVGHMTIELLSSMVEGAKQTGISGMTFVAGEGWVFLGGIFMGLIASLIPARQAFKTDISKTLSGS